MEADAIDDVVGSDTSLSRLDIRADTGLLSMVESRLSFCERGKPNNFRSNIDVCFLIFGEPKL